METQTLSKEELKKIIDDYLEASSAEVDAEAEECRTRNLYREVEEKFYQNLLSNNIPMGKNFTEQFIYQDTKITLQYRLFEKGKEIKISSEPYVIQNFDESGFEKDTSERAKLIIELNERANEVSEAQSNRYSASNKSGSLKGKVHSALKIYSGAKPLRYRDRIFQVDFYGYYSESRLLISDANIKAIQ